MHEFGNYLGTQEFAAIPLEVDEGYEAFLDTLSRDELAEETANLKAQIDALNNLEDALNNLKFDH